MIFDAHLHPFPNVFTDVRMSAAGHDLSHPQQLVELFEACGLAGGLLLAPPPILATYIEQVPHAYGLVWVAPRGQYPEGKTFVQVAEEQLEHPKIVGIKLHSLVDGFNPNWPVMDPLYDLAAQLGVALLFHTGHEYQCLPWEIAKAARRHPKATFVMAHMGLHTMTYVDAAIETAERTRNLYVDTAAMPYTFKIAEAIRRIGEDRVMYGSDAPFFAPAMEIEKVKLVGLTDAQLERVFATNALRIYFNDNNRPAL